MAPSILPRRFIAGAAGAMPPAPVGRILWTGKTDVTDARLVTPSERLEMLEHLHELVQAIDARRRRPASDADAEIARDAARLRGRALERIAELEGGGGRPAASTPPKKPGC
jgi:hypothetical protein